MRRCDRDRRVSPSDGKSPTPGKNRPATVQSLRAPSAVRMNAPLRVPTRSLTVLISSSLPQTRQFDFRGWTSVAAPVSEISAEDSHGQAQPIILAGRGSRVISFPSSQAHSQRSTARSNECPLTIEMRPGCHTHEPSAFQKWRKPAERPDWAQIGRSGTAALGQNGIESCDPLIRLPAASAPGAPSCPAGPAGLRA